MQVFSEGHSKPELFVADPRGYGHIMNVMADELGIKVNMEITENGRFFHVWSVTPEAEFLDVIGIKVLAIHRNHLY
jgi:hypothetical protein